MPPKPRHGEHVVAVVVVHSGSGQLQRNVATACASLRQVIVVDNSTAARAAELGDAGFDNLTLIENDNLGGLAGAYNRAIEWIAGHLPDTRHVLFLDEDTDVDALEDFLASPDTARYAEDPGVAAVAPAYVDSATGLAGAGIRLDRWRYRVLGRDLAGPTEVSFLINSMSLWRFDALRRIGSHDTMLAVDHVDTDYCLRAALLGYRLVLNPTVRFRHAIGNRRAYRLLGRTLQAGGHGPRRRWWIGRNTILLARRYGRRWPAFAALCLVRLGYEAIGIAVAEDDKLAKLAALVGGAGRGLRRHQETMPRPQ